MKIIYEQPLNELVRTTLRLEYLFQKLSDHIDGKDPWSDHQALSSLIDIVSVLDRPDLRSKLTKEFHRYISSLTRMKQSPNVDDQKLGGLIDEFQASIEILHGNHGKFGQRLRDNEFLSALRQRMANPGGTCGSDAPSYQYWLGLGDKVRKEQLHLWTEELASIRNISELMLGVIRGSGTTTEEVAQKGFFQKALDPLQPYQLIRVEMEPGLTIFPEISAGKHRAVIYFFNHSVTERPEQSQDDISFKLTLCII
jgi:cell division protein ZapD